MHSKNEMIQRNRFLKIIFLHLFSRFPWSHHTIVEETWIYILFQNPIYYMLSSVEMEYWTKASIAQKCSCRCRREKKLAANWMWFTCASRSNWIWIQVSGRREAVNDWTWKEHVPNLTENIDQIHVFFPECSLFTCSRNWYVQNETANWCM